MLKKFLIIFVIIFTTGCTATYNLDISNNRITESTNVYVSDSDFNNFELPNYEVNTDGDVSDFDEMINSYLNQDYLAFDNNKITKKFYEKKKISDTNGEGIGLKYIYTFNNFKDSSLLNSCGSNVNYVNDNGVIMINFDNVCSCFYDIYEGLGTLNFNIKTDLEVLENNADNVDGNVYSWTFNSENCHDNSLKIVMKKNFNLDIFNNNTVILISLLFIVLVIGFIIYVMIKRKIKNNNSI